MICCWYGKEWDGPAVQKPISRGFGTRSVIASIESQLGGQAEFDWRPEGLVCHLSVPLNAAVADSIATEYVPGDNEVTGRASVSADA